MRSGPSAEIIRAVPSGAVAAAIRRALRSARSRSTTDPTWDRSNETVAPSSSARSRAASARNTSVPASATRASRTLSPAYSMLTRWPRAMLARAVATASSMVSPAVYRRAIRDAGRCSPA